MTDPIEQAFAYLDIGHPTVKAALTEIARLRAIESRALAERKPTLAVCYGPMPESNGKSNWTAILHNGDISSGITLDRSEYPDRVRYEADRARWLIGELDEKPFILDYDADKHSGYVSGHPTPDDASEKAAKHWNPVYNTDPVQRACGELPDGFEIEILLEKDAGTVYLVNNNYGERDMMESEDEFEWMIHSAIDAAIDAAMQADKETK